MTELQIFLIVVGALLAANFLLLALFVLHAKLPGSKLKMSIRGVIFEIDRFADNMENVEKRQKAIYDINSVLGWRRVLIPDALIGWIIDAEVTAIRKMQRATNTPNLHEEE